MIRQQPKSLGGLPVQIDYTARDYEAIRTEMLRVASQLLPEWTDREPSDMGVTMVEAMAYVADVLSYGLDRVQNESYLATAQTREAVVNLLRLIGYELAPASPATVAMVVQTNLDTVVLPKGFKVSTAASSTTSALTYRLPEAVTLSGQGYHAVTYEAGKVARLFGSAPVGGGNDSLMFVAGEEVSDALGTSNGTREQTFVLPQSPVCLSVDGAATFKLYVNDELWEARTSFVGTEPSDQVYVYRFLSSQEVIILFGDGVNGAIPQQDATLVMTYRVGGGAITNRAGVGSITKFDSVDGVASVYNIAQPSGGKDPESIADAKKQGPLSLRALDRCVTLEDFETLAVQTPGGGVRTARASQGDSPLEVDVYVASQGSNPIPTGRWFPSIDSGYGLIGAVGRWLSLKKPVPTQLNVLAPTAINPYLRASIYVYDNVLKETARQAVETALLRLFQKVTDDFGSGVALSAVVQAVENTRGVNYVDTHQFHRIPSARLLYGYEDAFDAASVSVTSQTEQTQPDTYKLIWVTQGSYKLQSSSGSFIKTESGADQVFSAGQTNVASIYNSAPSETQPQRLEQFSINIQLGQDLPQVNDLWEFSVDGYLGNIEAQPYEIVVVPDTADGSLNSDYFNLVYVGGI